MRSDKTIQFTTKQYEFFDGMLTGDASVVKRKSRNTNCVFSIASSHKDFVDYIKYYLDLNTTVCNYSVYEKRHNTWHEEFRISKSNILFTNERIRWYPKDLKIIPNDFRFSPISMLALYLSDGCASGNSMIISLDDFDADNIENTIGLGFKNIDIKYTIRKNKKLYISRKSSLDFLNYIGLCTVDSYNYKWTDIFGSIKN